jgi:hypothetical protein
MHYYFMLRSYSRIVTLIVIAGLLIDPTFAAHLKGEASDVRQASIPKDLFQEEALTAALTASTVCIVSASLTAHVWHSLSQISVKQMAAEGLVGGIFAVVALRHAPGDEVELPAARTNKNQWRAFQKAWREFWHFMLHREERIRKTTAWHLNTIQIDPTLEDRRDVKAHLITLLAANHPVVVDLLDLFAMHLRWEPVAMICGLGHPWVAAYETYKNHIYSLFVWAVFWIIFRPGLTLWLLRRSSIKFRWRLLIALFSMIPIPLVGILAGPLALWFIDRIAGKYFSLVEAKHRWQQIKALYRNPNAYIVTAALIALYAVYLWPIFFIQIFNTLSLHLRPRKLSSGPPPRAYGAFTVPVPFILSAA